MQMFDFFFGVMLGELVLRHTDNLSWTLQSPKLSAAARQVVARMTLLTLQALSQMRIWLMILYYHAGEKRTPEGFDSDMGETLFSGCRPQVSTDIFWSL